MNNKNACLLACWLIIACLVTPPTGLAQSTRFYPSAKHGGNYRYNYYFPPAPSTTPWSPSWSPDGRSIAVAMSGAIWKLDPRTGVADQLTVGSGFDQLGSADFLIALRG